MTTNKCASCAELRRQVRELKARLEIVGCYDMKGNVIPHPTGVIGSLDGIAARDETIKLQDAHIDDLRAKLARYEAAERELPYGPTYEFICSRPDHIDVYDSHVLRSDYDTLRTRLVAALAERGEKA
jgi:hypothetical protein